MWGSHLPPGLPTWTMKHLWITWPLMLSDLGSCPQVHLAIKHAEPAFESYPPLPVSHPKLTFTEMGPQPDSTLAWAPVSHSRARQVYKCAQTYCSNHQAAHCLPEGRTVSMARNQDFLHPLRWKGGGSVSPRAPPLNQKDRQMSKEPSWM